MERFSIVLFRLIEPGRGVAARETGGGVVFVADPRPEDWHGQLSRLVSRRFRHALGPVVEAGFATLERATLERHCQRDGDLYWQGGDG
jgi:hypothetical protein